MMKQFQARGSRQKFKHRLYIASIVSLAFVVGIFTWLFFLSKDLPSLDELERYDPDLITRIVSADDQVIQELFTTQRTLVKSNEIPPHVKKALIVTEDQRFYSHWGMNLFRTVYNLTLNVATGKIHGGSSSLTQQLARSLYARIGFKQTYLRKLRELITAVQIEHTFTKEEILTMYLNTVYFGHGTYGLQAAATKYFHKRVENLTLDEGAILIGMLRAPAYYSPITHPDRSRHIRNVVINSMFREKAINAVERNYFKSLPIETWIPDSVDVGNVAPHFGEFIRRQLEKEDDELGVDLYRDGLTIYTSLDTRLQTIANEVVARELDRVQTIFDARMMDENSKALANILEKHKIDLTVDTVRLMISDSVEMTNQIENLLTVQAQLISLDVETGEIKAMVGGKDFSKSKWNRSTQMKRQPGSSFKAFLYTAAIDNGYPVTTTLLNQPVVIKLGTNDSTDWRPKNYDLSMGGETTMREGIRRSLNLIAVRTIQELIAPAAVVEKARAMGITTRLYPGDALALGASGVYPIEMAAAYAVYPRLGIWIQPLGIRSVQDRFGGVLRTYNGDQKEVLGRGTSYVMLSLLETVANRGTGVGARTRFSFHEPAGGKTGTTTGFTDAWYVGFTTRLSTAVWVGMDSPSISLGNGMAGSALGVPIWAQYMKAVYDSLDWEREEFEIPEESVVFANVCSETHKLATQYCTPEREVFLPGTIPTQSCDVHGNRSKPKVIDF
ncbi:MAG: PBP1A family penicillin-binding protein [Candidatus Marinimicrobia bacterium]|jgi:penicillin-binding protein 1A|nr:PBP1A family penicillin-binding protein [Candidatus Neomarinimicrobiota bacterium]MBT3575536.1 PBP1A family penicillin-binding protein [Candidatus Neomarinimicrobiota bacterium]MBT4253423.1 PBP1A family penicillin-binding protein [Candidatus Neomarinimicrobiota bacterium]MBT4481758.1 PBP1A family penicillin-binding protein [Candidatus Neomarinimicrobiota bacterium]MBT5233933.1 PBP1A family penicillin-binding protein [Candidatus Neomarinimicrobiota bacterium]